MAISDALASAILRVNFLQGRELRVAIGAPSPAIEDDHQRPATKQIFGAPEHAIAIGEFKVWRVIADLERPLR
jgi:hypothetical protein